MRMKEQGGQLGRIDMECSELIELIRVNDIAIYGAGYVAETFYKALQIQNLENRVKYFIETETTKTNRTIQGVPIITIENIDIIKEMFICIAVHDAVKDEIESILLDWNITNYIWIRPYLMELALGKMIERHKKIGTFELVKQEPYDDYALAVRYLAIENYYKKNAIGYDIYVKVFSKLCYDAGTPRKRLRNFISLIEDWDKNGYRQEKDISIDEKYRRIDGSHRMSLACYHKTKYLYYNLYPYSGCYDVIMGEWIHVGKDVLRACGLNSFELNTLEQANVRLREKWK